MIIKTGKEDDFTYIGNESNEYILTNTNLIKPLSGNDLANEIKNHHIYVTGSILISGNHHIEAAQCGLPILYRDSGGIPEYCDGFGVSFNDNFIEKLQEIIDDYSKYKNRIKKYPVYHQKMS